MDNNYQYQKAGKARLSDHLEAKRIYAELCEEFGTGNMNAATNGWGASAIQDYIKDGTIDGFIKSLYKND